MKTTIQVDQETLKRLQSHKQVERQSYDAVINRLLDEAEDDTLTEEDIQQLHEALEEVRTGKLIPIEDLAKELGVDL